MPEGNALNVNATQSTSLTNTASPSDGQQRGTVRDIPLNEMVVRVLTTVEAEDIEKAKKDLGQPRAVEMAQQLVDLLKV